MGNVSPLYVGDAAPGVPQANGEKRAAAAGRMKAARFFHSRAIGGPGAKPAREWQMRQGGSLAPTAMGEVSPLYVGATLAVARMPTPVPYRPSASDPAVPEPIQIIARQFPGVNASTSRLRRGCGGATR